MPFVVHQQRRIHDIRHVKPLIKNATNQRQVTGRVQYAGRGGRGRGEEEGEEGGSTRSPSELKFVTFKNIKTYLINNLKSYCETTSLHGLNYIVLPNISRKERLFWIFVVVISIIVSVALVLVSWNWNRETPTVTVIESSHFPTWNIPFPAVTICSFNNISKRKAVALAKTMKRPSNVSESELLQLFRITMHFNFSFNLTEIDYGLIEHVLLLNNYTIRRLADELTPNCLDMISHCVWKGTIVRCDSLFQRINTTGGVCCSFNYFGLAKNNFPTKIAYQVPKRPYRVTGCGYPTGLSIILDADMEDYFGTYFSSYGFRLLIHDAYDFPDENAETKMVTAMRESFVRINPEATYATDDIKALDPRLRNCLFADERRLSIMQRYSFVNCMAECRLRIIYKSCGCMPINLPNNGSYPTCEVRSANCISKIREIFFHALLNIKDVRFSTVRNTESFPCDCMPDCETYSYASDITMGRLNVNLARNNKLISDQRLQSNTSNYDVMNSILLHVFYSDLLSTRYRREVYENWLSALASFGGLLGLIMGFSIVTALEFLYFLTFRPIFNYLNDE